MLYAGIELAGVALTEIDFSNRAIAASKFFCCRRTVPSRLMGRNAVGLRLMTPSRIVAAPSRSFAAIRAWAWAIVAGGAGGTGGVAWAGGVDCARTNNRIRRRISRGYGRAPRLAIEFLRGRQEASAG